MTNAEKANALIDWIHGARYKSEKKGLDNMRLLLLRLGNPEKSFPCLHVAGTNGKGSVCAFTERVLREAGLHTGLYTSPYLCRYHERIRIDGVPVSDEAIVSAGARVREAAEALCAEEVYPTAFELGTALAFLLFAQARVDCAVLETGLGGRLDSTNVAAPAACAIAAIGMDHMGILGDTLEKIAFEKAGIIKPGVPVALYPQTDSVTRVFLNACAERGAPYISCADMPIHDLSCDARGADFSLDTPAFGALRLRVNLPGRHQVENARLAVALLGLAKQAGMPVSGEDVTRGMALARWPGRLEWLRPYLLADGAHNPQGAQTLSDYCETFLRGRRVVLVTGMMRDKQPAVCAGILARIADEVIATRVDWPRAMAAEDLAALYAERGRRARVADTPARALDMALASLKGDDVAVVCGSLYLVGEVRILENGGVFDA